MHFVVVGILGEPSKCDNSIIYHNSGRFTIEEKKI